MKWTIGMPSYNNFLEVFFTVQSLRMHHGLKNCEIIIIDNFGDDALFRFVRKHGNNVVKYFKHNEITGVSYAKNKIFEHAAGENVLVMDSHILLKQGALDVKIDNDDLYQGPLQHSCFTKYSCEWLEQWRGNMWGIWAPTVEELPKNPFEIWASGAGFFACKKASWLGFNPNFRGFGGESGYIQEKYRVAGRKVWCHPSMVWLHMFYTEGLKVPYQLNINDRIKNYIMGFVELGLDLKQIEVEFGKQRYDIVFNTIKPKELLNMKKYIFIQEHVFEGGVTSKIGDTIILDQNIANIYMSHKIIAPAGPEKADKAKGETADKGKNLADVKKSDDAEKKRKAIRDAEKKKVEAALKKAANAKKKAAYAKKKTVKKGKK